MKRFISYIFLFFIAIMPALAQNSFSLQQAQVPAIGSLLYRSVTFLDSRPDSEFYKITVNATDFADKLNQFTNTPANSSTQNGQLLFQLRHLGIIKDRNIYVARFRANLYDTQGANYYLVASGDITVDAYNLSNMQVALSKSIYNFVEKNLSKSPIDNQPYSINDINSIDMIEKNRLAVYNNGSSNDGIYISSQDFFNQSPLDDALSVEFNKYGDVRKVEAINAQLQKSSRVRPQDVFAIVYDGQAYVSYEKKFVPIYENKGDFYFVYPSDLNLNLSLLPIMDNFGGPKRSQGVQVVFKVDHLTGKILPVGKRY